MLARRFIRRVPLRMAVRYLSEEPASKSDLGRRGPVTMASLLVTMAVAGALAVTYSTLKKEKENQVLSNVTSVGKPALGGPWVLVDQDGVPRTDASYRGKMTLLYFGFTHCPDICPSEMVKVAKVMKMLESNGAGNVVQPIFITVDPARDTVGQLKHYSQDFHKSFQYLTGTTEQVAKAARAYRVYFSKVADADLDSSEEYLVDHSIVLYLVGADGEFVDFFTQRMEPREISSKILEYARQQNLVSKK